MKRRVCAMLCVICLLFTLVPSLISSASMMIIPAGAIAIGLSFLKWKKERKDMKGVAAE